METVGEIVPLNGFKMRVANIPMGKGSCGFEELGRGEKFPLVLLRPLVTHTVLGEAAQARILSSS